VEWHVRVRPEPGEGHAGGRRDRGARAHLPPSLAVRVAAWRASLILRVALVDWGNDFGFGIDVRVHITEAAHGRRRAAQVRTAMSGRALKGQLTSGYTCPTKQGVLLQPSDADQLSELLTLAVLKDREHHRRLGRAEKSDPAQNLASTPTDRGGA
jgi:hypothetical protein